MRDGNMTRETMAGRLVTAFGDVPAMRALYAPDIEWSLSASLMLPRPMKGIDDVVAFNTWVWTDQHRPDCTVTILDECGDDRSSSVRFLYSAHSLVTQSRYENEYTLFARADERGITHVFEALDTALLLDFLTGRRLGQSFEEFFAARAQDTP